MIICIVFGMITIVFIILIYTTWLVCSYLDDMNNTILIKSGKTNGWGFSFSNQEHKTIKTLPKISFENFLKIYNINRSAYKLCDAYVKRENEGKDIIFSFNFFNYIKYRKFKKNKDRYDRKMKMKEDECKVIGELIRLSKEDIEKARESANKNFEEAMNKISDITLKV